MAKAHTILARINGLDIQIDGTLGEIHVQLCDLGYEGELIRIYGERGELVGRVSQYGWGYER